mgnify:CR=1 FL=1
MRCRNDEEQQDIDDLRIAARKGKEQIPQSILPFLVTTLVAHGAVKMHVQYLVQWFGCGVSKSSAHGPE